MKKRRQDDFCSSKSVFVLSICPVQDVSFLKCHFWATLLLFVEPYFSPIFCPFLDFFWRFRGRSDATKVMAAEVTGDYPQKILIFRQLLIKIICFPSFEGQQIDKSILQLTKRVKNENLL